MYSSRSEPSLFNSNGIYDSFDHTLIPPSIYVEEVDNATRLNDYDDRHITTSFPDSSNSQDQDNSYSAMLNQLHLWQCHSYPTSTDTFPDGTTSDEYWNDENISVSIAIRKLMKVKKEKESALNNEIKELKLQLNGVEKRNVRSFQENHRKLTEGFEKEKEKLLFDHRHELNTLKKTLFQKETECTKLIERQEDLTNQVKNLNCKIGEASSKDEHSKFLNIIREKETQLQKICDQRDGFLEKGHKVKLLQTHLEKELILKDKELKRKAVTIGQLKEIVETKTAEILRLSQNQLDDKKGQPQSTEMSGNVSLHAELSKLKESNDHKEIELVKAKTETSSVKLEFHNLQDFVKHLECVVSQLENTNKKLKSTREEDKKKISDLSIQLNRSLSNEGNLKKMLEELSEHKFSDDSKITKDDGELKKETDALKKEILKSRDFCNQCRQENTVLKGRMKQLQVQYEVTFSKYQLREKSMSDQIKNLTENDQVLQTYLFDLNLKLEESANVIKNFENTNKRKLKEFEDLQNQNSLITEECSKLKSQCQTLTAELNILKTEKSNLIQIKQPLNDTISHLKSQSLDFTKTDETLKGQKMLKNKEERYRFQVQRLTGKLKQVEDENSKHKKGLTEMEKVIEYTKEEINQLRKEKEKGSEENKKLVIKLDRIASQNFDFSTKFQYTEKELSTKEIEYDILAKENTNLKENLQQSVLTIRAILKEKDNVTADFESMQKSIRNLSHRYQQKSQELETVNKEYKDLMASLEEFKEKSLSNKHALELSQKQEETLETELKNSMQSNDTLKGKVDSLETRLAEINLLKKQVEDSKNDQRRMELTVSDLTKETSEAEDCVSALRREMASKAFTIIDLQRNVSDLSKFNNEILSKAKELQDCLDIKENDLKKVTREFENVKSNCQDDGVQLKELKQQIKVGTERLEKVKQQNKLLKSALEEFQSKGHSYKSDAHRQQKTCSNLQKRHDMLQQENQKFKVHIGTLKARVKELQGMLSGTKHKSGWAYKNYQKQQDEIKKLRETICNSETASAQMKEMLFLSHFEKKKLNEEGKIKSEKLEKVLKTLNEINHVAKNQEEISSIQNQKLQQKVEELTSSKDILQNKLKNITEEHEQLSKDSKNLSILKSKREELAQQNIKTTEKNKKLESDFMKLVVLLKRLKKDRDALSVIVQSSEKEKERLTKKSKQLQNEIADAKNRLKHQHREEVKVLKDNEELHTTISSLKHTETLRSSEHKEILEKLADAEAKLNQFARIQSCEESSTDRSLEESILPTTSTIPELKQNKLIDSAHEKLILQLSSVCQNSCANERNEMNYIQTEMKTFLDKVLKDSTSQRKSPILKTTQNCERKESKIKPKIERRQRQTSQRFHKLYNDSNKIYGSLLSNMKSLMNSFSQYDDIIITKT